MPVDTSIYGQLRPAQIENPVNMLAKVMQLEHMRREGAMMDAKTRAYQQDTESKTLVNRLMGEVFQPGVDNRASNALYEGALNGSVGPTVANAERMDRMPAPTPGTPSINLATLAKMAAAGVKTDDLFNIYKHTQTGIKRDPNSFYEMPNGETRYFADPTKGINFDTKTGAVSAIPGFAETNAGIKGMETRAVEGAKADFDLLPLSYADQSGRPIGGSKGQYLGTQGAGMPGAQQQSTQAPQFDFVGAELLMQIPPQDRQKILLSAQSSGDNQFSVNYRLPDGRVIKGDVDLTRDSAGNVPRYIQDKADYIRGNATPEERMQFEKQAMEGMMRITDPKKRAEAIAHFYDQMNQPAGTPVAPRGTNPSSSAVPPGAPVLQSEAEREAQVGRAKMLNSVEEKRMKDQQERSGKDSRLYQQLKEAIPMARNLLKNATGSGAGALADQVMGFFGKSTKGAEAAQALDTLGGWMVSNVPRMEGPQSNIDLLNYQTMAARVADRSLPTEVRLAALDTLEQLQNKYAEINGVAQTGNGSAETAPAVPNAPRPSIPTGAINMLKSNPALRADFDAKYGNGASASILGK